MENDEDWCKERRERVVLHGQNSLQSDPLLSKLWGRDTCDGIGSGVVVAVQIHFVFELRGRGYLSRLQQQMSAMRLLPRSAKL